VDRDADSRLVAPHQLRTGLLVAGPYADEAHESGVCGTLTLTPALLTITADNKSKLYGAALLPLTASYAGIINGDTPASPTTPLAPRMRCTPAVTRTSLPCSRCAVSRGRHGDRKAQEGTTPARIGVHTSWPADCPE
jgi:hypothetical protein